MPLHIAARTGRDPSVITVLLKGGADPQLRDGNGKLAYELAQENVQLAGTDVLEALRVVSELPER